ncbi:MAG: hypothetical protein U9Q40_01425, partial [Campylobacterota bacterium]|nr:hypothetical protein [Campylobacterota bacterium]
MTRFEIISIIFGLSTAIFAVIGWLLNNLINQHKELNKSKSETTDSKFESLIQRLDDLVAQIGHLFRDQDVVTESISNLSGRV